MSCNLYSETLYCPKVPSARGYTMAQIFATDFGWSQSYPMSHKSQVHHALGLLFAREGVLPKMIVDDAKEMRLGEFAQKCKEVTCHLQSTEPYSPWSNSTKHEIRELKKGTARKLTLSGEHRRLWFFALEYESYVCLHTAHDIYQLDGGVPETVVLGETADISPFCEFSFWDWVKFREDGVTFPDNQMVLGKYLGPSIDVGPVMMKQAMKANELLLGGDKHKLTRVLHQIHHSNGMPVGTTHKQPAMDTHVNEVRFPDGRTKELAAKTITEAVYAQCNPDGNQYIMLDAIMNYRKIPDVAISWNDQVKIVVSRSTCGWELCCQWNDCSTSWQKLSDLKESHPLQVTEFALATGIVNEPAFNWWVTWVLKKRDQIISLVKHGSTRYHKQIHKFGIELPKTVDEAYTINKATGTTFWYDEIELEIKNVWVAFDVLPDGVMPPSDHQYMKCHMIVDVKMEDFCRKAWLVARGHMTKAPATLTHASIVFRETVHIALLVAALNDIDIWAADVLNAYITMSCGKKIWTTLGKEFGDNCGRKAIIV
ncbi:hypothetical protein ACHAW6_001785 [Cyclotella cf. meneghiniana]